MFTVYRWLLYLYPQLYRHEYADEMVSVFRDVQADVRAGSFKERISFRLREILSLLVGAVREHIRITTGSDQSISLREFDVRSEFRFPRSTVFLMSTIFGGVILAMEKANTIQVKYAAGAGSIWPSLPWFLGFILLFTCAAAMVGWGILFALGRTGSHRLANIQVVATGRIDPCTAP
jgi:hypothetical protein